MSPRPEEEEEDEEEVDDGAVALVDDLVEVVLVDLVDVVDAREVLVAVTVTNVVVGEKVVALLGRVDDCSPREEELLTRVLDADPLALARTVTVEVVKTVAAEEAALLLLLLLLLLPLHEPNDDWHPAAQ